MDEDELGTESTDEVEEVEEQPEPEETEETPEDAQPEPAGYVATPEPEAEDRDEPQIEARSVPELPTDYFTPEEWAELERLEDSLDAKDRLRAKYFISQRISQREQWAFASGQSMLATETTPEFMRVYGQPMNAFLANLPANQRNSKEAIRQARAYAVAEHASQADDPALVFEQAAKLMRGKATPRTLPPIPASEQVPAGTPPPPAPPKQATGMRATFDFLTDDDFAVLKRGI